MTARALPAASAGEIAVLGLGKSGVAAIKLLRARGYSVYASDSASSADVRAQASALTGLGIAVDAGAQDLSRIEKAALVVASPGIPPDAAPIATARAARREIVSEIELAIRAVPSLRYIAVTGTNGKTTTTALIGHILRALGVNAPDAGNIGIPLAEVASATPTPELVALELSSFQLHDTPSIDPVVGVLTNLSPDHLDRYARVDDYFADKALLFANAHLGSRWVINGDDPESLKMASGITGTVRHFSLVHEADAWLDRASGTLIVAGKPLMSRADLALMGDHNAANALAAALAVMTAEERFATTDARATIANALRGFRALAHRLELVGSFGGVDWINDSKATNIGSSLVAVQGMTRPTVLLLGGRHKGEPYTSLADAIRAHVKRVIAYGEAAELIENDLRDVVAVDRIEGPFEDVIAAARGAASEGDAVLLSPACSSYDMFKNYVERGTRFAELARQG